MRKYASTLVILGLLSPGIAVALGLGELTLHSYLNEPLRAEVNLLETAGLNPAQIRIRLATREDFNRAAIERIDFLTGLEFKVELQEHGAGRLHINSKAPVREPFLDFLLEARWPNGRLLREYTVLLDPPLFASPASVSAPEPDADAEAAQQTGRGHYGEARRKPTNRPGADAQQASRDHHSEAASPLPEAGIEYRVQRDDTLWSISRRARPGGSTIQQTMLDIQRLNPAAFIDSNINQLQAGYLLRLPTAAQITEQSFEQAIADIAGQERQWRDKLAAVAARELSAGGQHPVGAVGAEQGGRLQIAGVEGDSGASRPGADLSGRLDRVERDNADLRFRLASLAEQLDTLKRLVALKDEQIAALQAALARSAAETGAPAAVINEGDTAEPILQPLPAADTVEMVAGTKAHIPEEQPVPAAETGVPAAVINEGDTAEPILQQLPAADTDEMVAGTKTHVPEEQPVQVADTGEMAASAKGKEPVFVASSKPAPEADLINTLSALAADYLLQIIALLVIMLLAAAWMLRAKLSTGSFTIRMPGRRAQQEQMGGATGDDGLAGLEPVADEGLTVAGLTDDAAADSPARRAAPKDEAYAARFESGDVLAEADIYMDYGRFPQAIDLLQTAIAMEPVNSGYRLKLMQACVAIVERSEFRQQYADLQLIGDEPALRKARALLGVVDDGETWLHELPPPAITAADVAAAYEAAAREPQSQPESAAAASPAAETEAGEAESGQAQSVTTGEPVVEDAPAVPLDQLTASRDVTAENGREPQLETVPEQGVGEGLEQAAAPAQPEIAAPPGTFDRDNLSETPQAEDDEGLVFAADGDEIATKLDLARAYMDMGDDEGARSILDEVLRQGSDSQQREAQTLLNSID